MTGMVFANPIPGNIASGNLSIQQSTNVTTINQSSKATHFIQPAGSVTLNRISHTQGPSSIYGVLTAKGQIIHVKPAGIFFGSSTVVMAVGINTQPILLDNTKI